MDPTTQRRRPPWSAKLISTVDPAAVPGDIRLLTQPRRWGWLFNPISVYLVWPDRPPPADRPDAGPVGAVLEVTNTPWKECHHYPLALTPDGSGGFQATFDKELHVSPFLGPDLVYHLQVSEQLEQLERPGRPGRFPPAGPVPPLDISIDVSDGDGRLVLQAGMSLERQPVTAATLGRTLRRDGLPTHRISVGIHRQAARLLAKGVPFVPHPKRRTAHGSAQR